MLAPYGVGVLMFVWVLGRPFFTISKTHVSFFSQTVVIWELKQCLQPYFTILCAYFVFIAHFICVCRILYLYLQNDA